MSLLCLDCGNSQLKLGVHDGNRWLSQQRLDYAPPSALDDWLATQSGLSRAIACNVAGAAVAQAVEASLAAQGLKPHWVKSQRRQYGVRNHYEAAGQLGADRWAALIGARALHAGPALVVCAGTATTLDRLDAEGNFHGGLILPGLTLMSTALAQGTAQLPLAPGRFQEWPQNTADAIVSGCLTAQVATIERMFETLADEPGAVCLLSGGAAPALEPLLRLPVRRVDHLVLEGLARIGRAL